MRIFKRLDAFVLKSFLPLFAMTFFIVLFIVLMQFLWKYIDDLVGKGFSIDLLGELFFYAAICMVPMALPLSILLAALMTFGNFGEKFELTAMKASGISLLRVMTPLIGLITIVAVGAFFFQNDVLPKAQVKMWTLLFSMKQKSPELEIPEETFYDQIPGYNLFVKHKNPSTGMLQDVMIYDISNGAENASIVLADSARLAFTKDLKYLYLHIFNGEQFENLRDQQQAAGNVPFRREEFAEKELLIPFDANFNRLDEEGMRKQYVGKNITQLRHTIDSVSQRVDSMGKEYARELERESFSALTLADLKRQSSRVAATPSSIVNGYDFNEQPNGDSANIADVESNTAATDISVNKPSDIDYSSSALPVQQSRQLTQFPPENKIPPFDILKTLSETPAEQLPAIFDGAASITRRRQLQTEYKSLSMADEKKTIRRHDIEMIKKYTLSVACLIFFFIGAPLGAIIRKGGIGTPLVISVLLFLVYYIIDNTGYKMGRDGRWPVAVGMWLSTMILAPLGVYVTYKAMHDSAVFDTDRIKQFFNKLLRRKEERIVRYKEVIINEITSKQALDILDTLGMQSRLMQESMKRRPGYCGYFDVGYNLKALRDYSNKLEESIEQLTNLNDRIATNKLTNFPVMRPSRVLRISNHQLVNNILKIVFPIGLPIWIIARIEAKKLSKEIREAETTVYAMIDSINS